MTFVSIYVTHKNKIEANKIITSLLNKKLIACANSFSINSSYWWKNKIQNDKEIVTILKTKKENWDAAKPELEKIHPYKVPCIIKINASANKLYEDWIKKVTK